MSLVPEFLIGADNELIQFTLGVAMAMVLSQACLAGAGVARTLQADAAPERLWAAFRAGFSAQLRRWWLFLLTYPVLPLTLVMVEEADWHLFFSFDDFVPIGGRIVGQLCLMLMILLGCLAWAPRCRRTWSLTALCIITVLALGYGWDVIYHGLIGPAIVQYAAINYPDNYEIVCYHEGHLLAYLTLFHPLALALALLIWRRRRNVRWLRTRTSS